MNEVQWVVLVLIVHKSVYEVIYKTVLPIININ